MKKVTGKRISAAIITAIILTILFLAAACNQNNGESNSSNNGNNGDGGTVNENGGTDENADETDIGGNPEQQESGQDNGRILSEAPVRDLEGYEYRILSRGESYALWQGTDADAEEETGDPINDAVYKRNRTIEEKYNIIIVNKPSSDLTSSAKKAISSGGDEYDIMMGPLSNNFANTLSQSGMLTDLKNVPYIDLPKPWYDQKANEQLTISNKLYVTISDIGKVDKDATWSYLFNKKLISGLSLENPYQLVRDGKWTIDKMLEMCKGVSRDLNGDGIMGIEDQYGYGGGNI